MREPWRWEDAADYREHLEHKKMGLSADCENIREGRIQLVDADGELLLNEWAEYADDCGINAGDAVLRRIVAAVNACTGYSTEELEAMPTGALAK